MEWLLFGLPALGAAAFWWWFPRWQLKRLYPDITNAAERADAEDKFRRTLSQIFGGVALLVGLFLSFREIENTRDASRAQIEALRNQQVTQQFSKGVELLGEAALAERLGGIYTLEQVARQFPAYHWPVTNPCCLAMALIARFSSTAWSQAKTGSST